MILLLFWMLMFLCFKFSALSRAFQKWQKDIIRDEVLFYACFCGKFKLPFAQGWIASNHREMNMKKKSICQ